jgi:hypothetical protein
MARRALDRQAGYRHRLASARLPPLLALEEPTPPWTPVSLEVRRLIRTIAEANPLWGAPRIHGELLKLGIR